MTKTEARREARRACWLERMNWGWVAVRSNDDHAYPECTPVLSFREARRWVRDFRRAFINTLMSHQ